MNELRIFLAGVTYIPSLVTLWHADQGNWTSNLLDNKDAGFTRATAAPTPLFVNECNRQNRCE